MLNGVLKEIVHKQLLIHEFVVVLQKLLVMKLRIHHADLNGVLSVTARGYLLLGNQLQQAGVGKASGDRLMGEAIDHTPPRQILLLRPVIAGLALVLNLIALLSVLNSALMGVRERARDLAIFKAVGLTPKQVIAVVLVGVITLALVAIVVGVPVGIGLTYGAFVGLARMQGFTRPMPFIVNWIGLALTPFGICLVAMLGAALPAHWAARINVVNLLRYE